MVDPVSGLVAQTDFIPSIKAVRTWIESHSGSYPAPQFRDNIVAEEHVSQEERERRVKMLKDTARVIRDTVKAKCVGRPSDVQEHNPEALLRGLANLESCRTEPQGTKE